MKLIAGLGNTGDRYKKTRHNVGFMILDEIQGEIDLPDWSFVNKFNSLMIDSRKNALLCKPQTMMNSSGEAVSIIANYYKIDPNDFYVVHDDLDIKLGEYKIQKGKGPRDHKGLLSIYESLGTKDFWHVRIGVDNRRPEGRIAGEPSVAKAVEGKDYVLMDFADEELETLKSTKKKVVQELIKIII